MHEHLNFFGVTTLTGHGNPYSLLAAINRCKQPGDRVHIAYGRVAGGIASVGHRFMRKNDIVARNYQPEIRDSGIAKMIGTLAWMENFIANARLQRSKDRSNNILLLTQELTLWPFVYFPTLLTHLFPSERMFLLIPDAHAKPNVPPLLHKLGGRVKPICFTTEAVNQLDDQGIRAVSVQPWLTHNRRYGAKKHQPSRDNVIFKMSGSGAPKKLINEVTKYLQDKHPTAVHHIVYPDKTIIAANGSCRTIEHQRLPDAYAPFLEPNIVEIASPASEVIGIAAQMTMQGWTGQHTTVTINGSHEQANYAWGLARGLTRHMKDNDEGARTTADSLAYHLGQYPIEYVVRNS